MRTSLSRVRFYAAVKAHFTLISSYEPVPRAARTGIEPLDIVRAAQSSVDYLGDG